MPEQTRDLRDVLTGALLTGSGLAVLAYALANYRLGTPAAMGPGFFPAVLGGALALLGAAIGLTAWRRAQPEDGPAMKPRAMLAVTAGIFAFALTVRSLGFVPVAFLLVLCAGMADATNRLTRLLLLGAALTLLSWAIFVLGLGMPLSAFNL